ncbi:Lsr2 family protein [Micromonospora sp. C51]|uniref:histone-like nucleoid-structuring protein Lsr2 n=1 Tax=Micromonospora sp. C51 TaxID=2824879 RepID=UPI001B37D7DF|nr:Lsr2 family protein [Micromonospora sp. C51]MBQ1047823.1 Lsr2 family protein [Micromonospora sp. C51]
MARQEVVVWTDDLDGEPIDGQSAKPTTFGFDGVTYEIDLRPDNRQELMRSLQPYMRAGRRLPHRMTGSSRFQPPPRAAAKIDEAQRRDIRNWWTENWENAGLPRPSAKGRIPEKVQQAYQDHQGRRVHKRVSNPFTPAA